MVFIGAVVGRGDLHAAGRVATVRDKAGTVAWIVLDRRVMVEQDVTQNSEAVRTMVRTIALAAKQGGRRLASAPTAVKDAVLRRAARGIIEAAPMIAERNAEDLRRGEERGLAGPMLERLMVDRERIEGIAAAIEEIAALPDPVGAIDGLVRRPNGLQVGKMRVPLGLIAIIYESRPNVTADAAALCIKSGNGSLLRSGSEALRTSEAIADVFSLALAAEGLPPAAVSLIRTPERAAMSAVMDLSGIVDLLIPRGGEGLIRYVTENARVPVIQHYKGVCHVYVDRDADLAMAERIVLNSKTHRPSVCNSAETLLVDAACASEFLPRIAATLENAGVELRGDERARAIVGSILPAREGEFDTEHLGLAMSVAVVDGIDGALAHVAEHGTHHTEAIVTRSYERAQRWLREADASLVLVNASTRFNDGGQLGLGAEMGISTTKMHAYGPMGLEELCTRKWIALGEGQIRG